MSVSSHTRPRHSVMPGSTRGSGGGHSSAPYSSTPSTIPKPPVQFSSSITLSDSAQLTGRHTILISSDSVVHPRAKIDSSQGRVHVGRRCIIHERSHLGGIFDFSPPPFSCPSYSSSALASTSPPAPALASASASNLGGAVAGAGTGSNANPDTDSGAGGEAEGEPGGLNRDSAGPLPTLETVNNQNKDSSYRGSLYSPDRGVSSGDRHRETLTTSQHPTHQTLTRTILAGNGIATPIWNQARNSLISSSSSSSSLSSPPQSQQIRLGDFITIEAGALVEPGVVLGDGTTVGVGSVVGAFATLGKHCTLAPYSIVPPGEKLPDNTVVYGGNLRRLDRRGGQATELRHKAQNRHIDVLRRMVKSDPAKFQ